MQKIFYWYSQIMHVFTGSFRLVQCYRCIVRLQRSIMIKLATYEEGKNLVLDATLALGGGLWRSTSACMLSITNLI